MGSGVAEFAFVSGWENRKSLHIASVGMENSILKWNEQVDQEMSVD